MSGPSAPASAGGRRPTRRWPCPRSSGGEDVGDDRQRRRHDERAADAHERAGGDQLLGAVGERRRERAETEDHEPDLQCTAPAEPVAEAAGGEQQAGEHQRVRVDHPLQLAVASRRGRARCVGIATLRIVLSSTITSRLKHSTSEDPASGARRRWPATCSARRLSTEYDVRVLLAGETHRWTRRWSIGAAVGRRPARAVSSGDRGRPRGDQRQAHVGRGDAALARAARP